MLTIPISNCEQAVAEMNAFLRGHKIIAVTKEFVATGENSFYSIIAEYIDNAFAPAADKGTASVDYKEVLKPEVFELFSYLRDERKKLAEQAGIPVYAVVTNAQLAQIAEKKPQTISALAQIEGVGQGKYEKFGEVRPKIYILVYFWTASLLRQTCRCFEPPPSMAVLKRVSVKVSTV